MKIWFLLFIGMFGIFLTFGFINYVISDLSIQEIKKLLGTRNESISFDIMQGVDQSIEKRFNDFKELSQLDSLQTSLKQSNNEFKSLDNVEEFIKQFENNNELKLDSNEIKFDLLDKNLSTELIETIQFYKDEYDYDVIEELSVINEFGVPIASGSKIVDTLEENEEWWQITKNEGIYVGDLKFVEAYGGYSIDLGIKITDKTGNFLGAISVSLSLDDLLREFIEEAEIIDNENRKVMLLDNKGRIIYSNGIQDIFNSEPVSYIDKIHQSDDIGFIELTDEINDLQQISFAKSTGYRSFNGFEWITVVEQNDSSFVNEFVEFRSSLFLISVTGIIVSIIISLLLSLYISKHLKNLSIITKLVSKGNFNVLVKKSNINEIDMIGASFNKMAMSLKKLMETEKELAEANVKVKNERLTAMGELAASMSHDLKNPLATIRSGTDILKREFKGQSVDIDDVFSRINRAILRISHQIEDVLNYVRITPLKEKSISTSTLIKSALESIENPNNIKIDYVENANQIKCDVEKIEIVLINVLLNSIQAIGDKTGKISIRTKEENDFVFIEIQDTGEGVPDEIISKIFQPLITTKEHGTGLGLSTSKNIVEQHNGTITVSNNPTTFIIKLPKSHV